LYELAVQGKPATILIDVSNHFWGNHASPNKTFLYTFVINARRPSVEDRDGELYYRVPVGYLLNRNG